MTYERPSTVERAVVAEMRRMILQGDLKPGSVISLDEVAKTFGVSRVPVRDALRILEGEGLVVAQPHKGYQVARLDMSELEEITEIRQILETDAIIRAAEHLTDEKAAKMAGLLERMIELEDTGDMANWVGVHREFHFVIFDAADSTVLVHTLHTLWNASDLYRAEYLNSKEARRAASGQHGQLVEAVRARDLVQLISVMTSHRRSTVAALTEALPHARA